MTPPQDQLLQGLIDVLPPQSPAEIDEATKQRLAEVVRAHYRAHPAAIDMQASGNIVPPTVKNHS